MSQYRIDIGPPCCLIVWMVHTEILRVLPGTIVDLLPLGLFKVFVKLRRRAKVMSLTSHICPSYIQLPGTFLAF